MGGSCYFHRLLALYPQGVENQQQTYWQVWTLLSPGKLHSRQTPSLHNSRRTGHAGPGATSPPGSSARRDIRPMEVSARCGESATNLLAGLDAPLACARLGKLHRFTTREEQGTQDRGPRVHQALQQGEISDLWKYPTPVSHSISETFRPNELAAALRRLKPGKSPGLDSIFPEFVLQAGSAPKSWFCDFLISCMRQLKIRKVWRRELIVAIPKPDKPLGDPKSYRPMCLL